MRSFRTLTTVTFALLLSALPISGRTETKLVIDQFYVEIAPYIISDFQRLYSEIGEPIEISIMPGERAIQLTMAGFYLALDGRFKNPKTLKNLIVVDVPIYASADTVAYSSKSDLVITRVEDIKNVSAISILGSAIISEFNELYDLEIQQVQTLEQAIKMVESGRADVLVTSDLYLNRAKSSDQGLNLKAVSPALHSEWIYHHVHESRADLVPKLAAKIKELQETEGLFYLR